MNPNSSPTRAPGFGRLFVTIVSLFATFGPFSSLPAADSDTQSVTLNVNAINELELEGGAVTLTVTTATAGATPTAASNNTPRLRFTTNESGKRITVAANAAIPSGVTLTVATTSNTPAFTQSVNLTNATGTSAVDLIPALGNVASNTADGDGLTVTLTASAGVDVAPFSNEARTLTFTLTDTD